MYLYSVAISGRMITGFFGFRSSFGFRYSMISPSSIGFWSTTRFPPGKISISTDSSFSMTGGLSSSSGSAKSSPRVAVKVVVTMKNTISRKAISAIDEVGISSSGRSRSIFILSLHPNRQVPA